ncbi:NAD(P)H-binding protein [Nocardia transvalensis]|uniref:NAD(P)H-binding protein n=1 Tax=Nocardia transvalensis TaxID=37333 RepID=UPI0018946951|nr:NAD(P)H-binding protein [Nocardia transvalensis]MBF6332875.1 NAD(P)H-binding protein [Nocardia transvalensis]
MILVTGATGTVGRAVVEQLRARGVAVRAMTRRPETARLPEGVEVVGADLGDTGSLVGALEGIQRVFLLSAGPEIPRHDANLAKAAAAAGVVHIVKLSSGRTGDDTATDPIPTWHRAGERAVRESGVAWTMVRPLGFMSNALHWAATIRDRDTVYAPFGQGRIAVVDPGDIAAVAVAALTEPGHEGQVYTLSGPQALGPGEQTGILAEVIGRPLHYVETSAAEARAALLRSGVDAEMADAIMALRATALESFTSVVHPTVEAVIGRPPRSFREWVLAHRTEFA